MHPFRLSQEGGLSGNLLQNKLRLGQPVEALPAFVISPPARSLIIPGSCRYDKLF